MTMRFFSVLFLCSLFLGGCVSIIDATRTKPIETDESKRSFGEKIDDRNIKTIVAVNIKKAHPSLDRAPINVYAYRGLVLLTGQVTDKELKTLAGNTAREVARVRQVYNEIEVSEKQSFWSNVNDNLIESHIDSKLILNKYVDASRVEVVVENGVVYLMGTLTTEDTEKVTEIVSKTQGVKKVVRAIEYIEEEQ